jgi:hypothetical protein
MYRHLSSYLQGCKSNIAEICKKYTFIVNSEGSGSILLCSSEIDLLGGVGGGGSVSGVHSNDASYLKEPWFSNPRTTSSYMHEGK